MGVQVYLGLSNGEARTVNSYNDKIFWEPQKEPNPHLLISGSSGSGKTETLKVICQELKSQGVPLLIFDFHNDFLGFADQVIHEKNVRMHPLQILKGEKPIDVVYKISSILTNTFNSITPVQEGTIREAIKHFYKESKITNLHEPLTEAPTLLPFTLFPDFLAIASMDQRTLSSIKVKLDILFDYELFDARYDSIDFDSLLTGTTVFKLKNAPSDHVKRIVTEIMINKLIQYSYNLEQSKDLRLFCLIDEAHRMVYPGSPVDTLLREARKYGIGVILASQRATDFNETILANAGTIITFKQNLAKDARYIAKNKWGDQEQLMNAVPGVGYIRMSSRKIAMPVSIVSLADRQEKKTKGWSKTV
jgi:DNA phosphorothioation-dependent restriction protein DptH